MGLLSFFAVLRARFMLIAWTLLICVGIAILIGLAVPSRFKAEAVIQVDARTENLLTGMMEPRQRVQEFLGQQSAIIGSRANALLVIEDLIATGDMSLRAYEELWRRKTDGELLPGNDLKIWIADDLLRHTEISADPLKSTLTIRYTGPSPALSARYANAFADAYMILVTNYRKSDSYRNAAKFGDESETFKKRLQAARDALHEFQQRTGFVTIGTQQLESAEVELGSITARLAEARADDAEAQSLAALLKRTPRKDYATLPMPNALAPGRTAQARLATLIAQMKRIDDRYGPQHPDYIEAKSEIARLENVIHTSVLERAKYTKSRVDYLNKEAALQRQRVLDLQDKKQQFDILEKDVETARQTYDLITARTQQEGLQARVESVSVFLLNQAVPTTKPSQPTFWMIVVVGFILGLGLGGTLAVFVELMEARVRGDMTIQFSTRRPVLATMRLGLPHKRRLLA